MNKINRRAAMGGVLASTAICLATRSLALTDAQAKLLIDRAVGDINRIINSGKSERAMFSDFENLFRRYGDVSTIARSALGPPARQANRDQLNRFATAFTGYLARKYGRRFREFIGGEILVTGARKLKSFHEVKAVANLRGQPPFAISFMVSDKSGQDKFFDIVIEGISLLKAERAEIGAMLDRRRGNLDAMIADLAKAG